VRVGVVDGDPGVLSENDDQHRDRGHHQRRARREPRSEREGHVDPRERNTVQLAGQSGHCEHQDRLGQRREMNLPAGAHALEARSGVQGADHSEKSQQAQEVGQQYQIAGEGDDGPGSTDRKQQQRRRHGRQPDDRSQSENRCCRPAVYRALTKQPEQVEIGLDQRRPAASGNARLYPADDPQQKRGQRQGQ